uniref:Uncharacterized protein n=1 Tax=Arundo donax TaxID=35708 RepID=A0A0A8ZXA1_ARUDO
MMASTQPHLNYKNSLNEDLLSQIKYRTHTKYSKIGNTTAHKNLRFAVNV